jgi:hypothetical protein
MANLSGFVLGMRPSIINNHAEHKLHNAAIMRPTNPNKAKKENMLSFKNQKMKNPTELMTLLATAANNEGLPRT